MKHFISKYSYIFIILAVLVSIGAVRPQPARADSLIISKLTVDLQTDNQNIALNHGVQAIISWYTNLNSDGRVDYGTTTSYGFYIASSLAPSTYHEVVLGGLQSETTYHFKITSNTIGGDHLESFDQTFKTPKFKDTTLPVISDVHATFTGATYTIIVWNTDKKTSSSAECSLTYDMKRPVTASGTGNVFVHEVVVRLKKGINYYCRSKSKDKDGNEAASANFMVSTPYNDTNEKDPLAISQVSPVSFPDPLISDTSVTFNWHTSRPSRGVIQFRSVRARGGSVSETGYYNTEHQLTLYNLKPGVGYWFKINAKDVLGKSFVTGEAALTTNPSSSLVVVGDNGNTNNSSGNTTKKECKGPYVYGVPCRDLSAERSLAKQLRNYLDDYFRHQTPFAAMKNWFVYVKAYVYGGYPINAIVQSVKYGGKTVHPTIPWSQWKDSPEYQEYINKQ